jgi:hypothetical protein
MDDNGQSCFPSTKTLAVETGLSERTVCTHLEIAEKNGWIEKTRHGYTDRGWKRHSYKPLIPDKALKEVQHLTQQGTEPDAQGTELDDKKTDKALKEVQSNSRIYNNSTSNSTEKLATLLFDLIRQRHPKHKKPNMQLWTKQIALAISRDDRTPAELEAVIRWCQADEFWQNNILSTKKLREQFDKLYLQMEASKNDNRRGKNTSFGKSGATRTRSTKYNGIGTTIN